MRLIAWLALFVLAGPAALDAWAQDALYDDLMRKSGLWRQVAQIEPLMQAGLGQAEQAMGKGGDTEFKPLREAVAKSFAPDRMRTIVRARLMKALPVADARMSLEWLDTETGRRITALEETAGEVAETANRAEIAAQILAALPATRVERLTRFAKAAGSGEYAFRVQAGMAFAIGRGIAAATGRGTVEIETARRELDSQRAELVQLLERQSIAEMAVIYGPLSDQDLDAYIAFAESPAGRRYHAASAKAVEAALAEAAESLGRFLGSKTAKVESDPSRIQL